MNEYVLNGQSIDIIGDNILKLKSVFPEVFSDGKIDYEKFCNLFGNYIDKSNERYNFSWHGKSAALRFAQTPTTGTLRPCKEKSKSWDNTKNIYIEGDNLEVLKLLQKSYHNAIKMIYIDPPYNTGSDFVYNDDFKDNIDNYKKITGQTDEEGKNISTNSNSDGRYHTNWLNMMYPRLKLAKNLLSDDGVIFISIDDNEVNNLRKLCDEIFGEDNCQGLFIVNSTPNARDYGHIGKMHEFVLFYSKNSAYTTTNMLPDENKTFKYSDDKGGYNIHPLYNSNEAFTPLNRPNLYYPFYLYTDKPLGNNFYEIGLQKREGAIEIYPPKSLKNNVQFVWRWGKDKSNENLNKEIIGYKTEENEYRIVQKMRHSEKIIRSLLLDKAYSSRRGTAEVEELFKGKIFSFPKPVTLLKDLIKVGTNNNDIILDFFSGSSTTAHACMQLNAEDGGSRRYIMVQLPELLNENTEASKQGYKTICDIGEKRIDIAGEKIKAQSNSINDLDIGYKVFKLDTSNIKKWVGNSENIANELQQSIFNYVEGRTQEDILYEVMLKCGLDLTYPVKEIKLGEKIIYTIGNGAMFVCMDDDITQEIADKIVEMTKENDMVEPVVVFKDNGFATDSVKTNIKETLRVAGIKDFITI